MSKIEWLPATGEMAARFYGRPPYWSLRAHMAVLDGAPIAIAGVRTGLDGRLAYLFCDLKPEARRFKKAILRFGRDVVRRYGRPGLAAIADPDEPNAARFLCRLGLVPMARTDAGNLIFIVA